MSHNNLFEVTTQDTWEKHQSKEYVSQDDIQKIRSSSIYKKCSFSHITFSNMQLQSIIFIQCTFTNIIFDTMDFHFCAFSQSTLTDCIYRESNIPKTCFNGTKISNCVIEGCLLNYSRFLNFTPKNFKLSDCNLYGVLFPENAINSGEVSFKLCNQEESYFVS